MMERVLVCGGRDFADRLRLYAVLDDELIKAGGFEVVIHGRAPGADSLARDWALGRLVPEMAFPADWSKHGKAAGPIRNQQMLNEGEPTLVVAFPGGRGTQDMVGRARRHNIPVVYG